MKRLVTASLLLCVVAIFMPMLFMETRAEGEIKHLEDEQLIESDKKQSDIKQVKAIRKDSETVFMVKNYDEITETTMADHLVMAVAAEMPVTFEFEALKAQAVAARTYIIYCTEHENPRHPDADVCCDSSCCLAYKDEKELRAAWGASYEDNMELIRSAVEATDGQVLCYGGETILAAFHSSSAGKTENGTELWGDVPYLTSVSSPESENDVPNFVTRVEVTVENFRETIAGINSAAVFEGDALGWLGDADIDDSGRVRSITVGGQTIPGTKMRSAFALRSTAFTLTYTDGIFVFTVTGYGHGLGMSQYGANVLARKGFAYNEILEHYYSGAELT